MIDRLVENRRRARHKWAVVFAFPQLAFLVGVLCVEDARAQPAYRDQAGLEFRTWIEQLWPQAKQSGVSRETFDRAFQDVHLEWTLPDLSPPTMNDLGPPKEELEFQENKKRQPEFDQPDSYFPESRITSLVRTGRVKLAEWKETFGRIERQFGVDAAAVLAVWARESAFGTYTIPHDAIQALATQAFMGRRKGFFTTQLIMGLQILQDGHVSREDMKSSWAGAMGHTQFLPSDFRDYAVDFDGDGRRDIWRSIPDALASTANYLKKNGWQHGKPWGYEVRVPGNFDCTLEGKSNVRTIAEWSRIGILRTYDRAFPRNRLEENAALLMPSGIFGPAFLVLKNFYVIKSYNPADLYALYVGHLADRVANDQPFESSWRPVETFTRDWVRRLQTKISAHGYPIAKIDGIIGPVTRAAVGKYQRRNNLPVTCYPSQALSKGIRSARN